MRAIRAFLPVALLAPALLSGCIIHDNDGGRVPGNAIPDVQNAEAGCAWSDWNGDWIWYFEADAIDLDGPWDVVEVWADVYDTRGDYIESFSLYRETVAPEFWFSDWLQHYSYLDCIAGDYVVDIVAYDIAGEFGIQSVVPRYNP